MSEQVHEKSKVSLTKSTVEVDTHATIPSSKDNIVEVLYEFDDILESVVVEERTAAINHWLGEISLSKQVESLGRGIPRQRTVQRKR